MEWFIQSENYDASGVHIENRTGRIFIADETESDKIYDGDNTDTILIDDCISIKEIKIGTTIVDKENYFIYPTNSTPKWKLVYRKGHWPKGNQNITINAKWGYSVDCPRDITLATTILVSGIINYAWKDEGEVQSMTIGRYTVSYKNEKQWQDFEKIEEILTYYQKQVI